MRALLVARLGEDHHAGAAALLAQGLDGALPPRRAQGEVEHDDVGAAGRQVLPGLVGAPNDDGQPRLAGPARDEQIAQQLVRDDEDLDGTHGPWTLGTPRAPVVPKMQEKRSAISIGTVS
ncbi:hypothetical protein GCM10023204_21450 [Actinomycetospora succinea]